MTREPTFDEELLLGDEPASVRAADAERVRDIAEEAQAGAERFASDAHFARMAGLAPMPASSGRRDRHRLHSNRPRALDLWLEHGK